MPALALALSVVAFFLGALCKEPALTLPLLLVGYDQLFGKPAKGMPDGVIDISLGDGNEDVRTVSLDGAGRIVLAGNTLAPDGSINMVVVRLNADGTPDQVKADARVQDAYLGGLE